MMWRVLQESYDRSAPFYDDRFASLQVRKYEALLDGVAPPRPVLDLGCGTGLLAEQPVFRSLPAGLLWGVDISARMLERAARRGVRVVQAEGGRLPFRDASFGSVCAFTVLRLFPEPVDPILREVRRVLRPGGPFLVSILATSHDDRFEGLLHRLGFDVEARVSCGQDVGYRCRRRSDSDHGGASRSQPG